MEKNNRFILYAVGIFISYFYFGILQEKITRGKYVKEETNDGLKTLVTEKFEYALTLVFVQCVINYLVANVALKTRKGLAEDKTRTVYYASVAVTYLLAMVSSNMALQWVSYPTQVVGKSAKPIPVMILGVLLGKKSYPFRKYLFILLIVLGITLFMFKDKAASVTQEAMFGIGELLLVLSLLMDGLVGAIQERMRAESKPTGLQMMKATNWFASVYLVVTVLLTGEALRFYEFAGRHPEIYYNLVLLGVTSAIGQLFLYSMVSDFGPLPVSIVTTSRKFFTVLGSIILFGNSLLPRQWFGATLVFLGLFLDAFYSKSAPKKK